MTNGVRDGWDKAAIVLQPVGGLLAALAVGALGLFGSQFLERREASETRVRVYSELMSKREEAESALRKDMFLSIIESFLGPGSTPLESKVLNLELLAYNFHESLNLKPLFAHLTKQIAETNAIDKKEYMVRLHRVAREVMRKQMLVLESAGKKYDRTIDLEELRNNVGGIQLDDATLRLGEVERQFRILVLKADPELKELKIRLEVTTPLLDDSQGDTYDVEFRVGYFDFPIVDNTRLSRDQRCAIVLNAFDAYSADITVVYFPGSYASLREKPYYEEVMQKLLQPQ